MILFILEFIFRILAFLGFYVYGFLNGIHHKDKVKLDSTGMPELMDEDVLAEVSEIHREQDYIYNKKQKKILAEICQRMTEAAEKGKDQLDFCNLFELNDKIKKYFTKNQISSFFEEKNYQVKFEYRYIDDAEIETISWNKVKNY